MRKSRFSEEQIVGILKEHEAGAATASLCRRHGISRQTFYRWKRVYGGLEGSQARRLKALEEENARLKRLVAEQALDNQILKDLLRKNAPCAGGAPWRMKMAAAILGRPAGARG
jgi:putative transposase